MDGTRKGIAGMVVLCGLALALPGHAESAEAKAPSLAGPWLGTLKVPPATELRIVFNILAHPDGSLAGTLDSLDQGATGIALGRVSLDKKQVVVEVSAIGGRYEGTLSEDGSTIEGKWVQSGIALDLVMNRVPEAPKPRRPQEPQRPYPYSDEEVSYPNARDGVTLAGTLTRPRTGAPFPAVILITGSGSQDRDETVFGHRPFLVLADFLTRRGFAVLRVDDRGVGGSTGDASRATSEDFARDVLAGLEYLQTRKEIDPKRLGLIGHSEGANIAPMVAAQSSDVSFIVLLAGTGVTGDLIIEKQVVNLLKAQGADQALIDTSIQSRRRVIDVIKHETDPNRVKEAIRRIVTEAVSQLDEKQKQIVEYNDQYVEAQVRTATSPWLRFFVTYDPTTTLRQVKCPVLALNGALDMQVPARDNLPLIEQALREGGNTNFTVRELPGLNHLFQTARTGNFDEYAKIEETMAPLALETVAGWLETQVLKKK
jgi:fermentation-respiration switch protein FrsA (DUF1100 family)